MARAVGSLAGSCGTRWVGMGVRRGPTDHESTQRNVAEVDKLTGRFNGQLKTDPLCGAFAGPVSHMTPFSNWPRLMASSQRTAD
jgi:hypothetical protein